MYHSVTYRSIISILTILLSLCILTLQLGASTDTITWGGDVSRCGYQPNHNLDPAVVGSPSFGQIFNTALPGNFNGIGPEQIFSQPLVFTGNDGVQYVYLATTQNNIYKLDAKTGVIVASRSLHVPFLTAELEGCVDINPTIGITATGTIDPATGIWYLTAKTYSDTFQTGQFSPTNRPGRLNGRYYFHGIDTQSANLTDAFDPVLIDGTIFRNNPNRMFIGGNQHQRPGLLLVGNYVYAGYASHCVQYNFTGAIIGHNKQTGAVVEAFAIEGGPEPNDIRGGGVWMSGGGISYDGAGSMFFSSGNGYASQLSGTPIPGRQPPTALEEAVVNAKINEDGTLSVVDFFMPWEKEQLDGADKDLGTTPFELLPPDVFTCPNVRRMGIVTGKSGKTYVLNLDNLGGYQMGINKLDTAVFVYQNENSVYAGAGVLPLGGGYIYINIIKYRTRVFKFSCDSSGNPQFIQVSSTAEFNAVILGTGHGTTTSLNGQDGTGLYWVSDVEGLNLRIYNAIPPSSGSPLTLVNSFNIPGVTKFTRPVFGDGRLYIGTTAGSFYGFGSPVNLPLNCSSPNQFGSILLNTTSSSLTIICKALVETTVTGLALTGNQNFVISNVPSPGLRLAAGQTFTFQVAFTPKSVGALSSDIVVNTTNAVAGYTGNTPVTLIGTGRSGSPLLTITPNTVSFDIIAGQQPGGTNQTALLANIGDGNLTVQSVQFSRSAMVGSFISANSTSSGDLHVGPFTLYNVPQHIKGNTAASVIINYNPNVPGNDAAFMNVMSNGGTRLLDIVAVAGTYPTALIEFQSFESSGEWIRLDNSSTFTFGNVTENQTKHLKLRITNNGTKDAVPLSVTVSKPPYGVPGIVGAVNNLDLAEGTILAAGQSATATLFCSVPKSQVNLPSYSGSANWTINTGDPTLGKQFIQFNCNAVSEQVGPLLANGTAKFGYVGCFLEDNPGRQLAVNLYSDISNTNNRCIAACAAAGWMFAGTQYESECWCGNAIPIQQDLDRDCNYACSGNENQTCGGNGYFHDKAHISLFADSTLFNGQRSSAPLGIPRSVNGYNYQGCYSESNGKALTALQRDDEKSMSVELCSSICSSYQYFALEYAQECYCANSINSAAATLGVDGACNMPCRGNNSEYCGAGNKAQLYARNATRPSITFSSQTGTATPTSTASPLAGYSYLGCYSETHDRRALNDKPTASDSNTLESCASFCLGYNYFGVEYGRECYCGNTLYSQSMKQTTESGCSMPCAGNTVQTCGGPDLLNIYYTNATGFNPPNITDPSTPTVPSAVPSMGLFTLLGCYTEATSSRALTAAAFISSTLMTVEYCAQSCAAYTFFGVEYASECYCGNNLAIGSVPAPAADCAIPCAGNGTELCGGGSRLSLYARNGTATPSSGSGSGSGPVATPEGPTVPARVGNYVSVGCYFDNVGGRALPQLYANDSMTLDICAAQAQAAGAKVFGVEYGRECWFGESVANGNGPAAASSCTIPCPGNGAQYCGDGDRLQLFSYSMVVSSAGGSVISLASSLSSAIPWAGGSSVPVSPSAASAASNSGMLYVVRSSGLSDDVTANSLLLASQFISPPTPSSAAGSSGFPTSLVQFSPIPTPTFTRILSPESPSPRISSIATLSVPASTMAPTSSTSTTVSGYIYKGCYSEVTGRTLSATTKTASDMTIDSCAAFCSAYAWFGVEYGSECWCGPYPRAGAALVAAQSDCSMKCVGNADQMCGGSNRLSMYYSGDPTKSSLDPFVPVGVGRYSLIGCAVDSPRLLRAVKTADNMTVESCIGLADAEGYAWAGLEYGRECWFGQSFVSTLQNVTTQQCNTLCKGNVKQYCGGSSRLQLYHKV